MTEKILFGEEARIALLNGVNAVCNAAKPTLGSGGRNVVIGNRYMPKITKDGVSVIMSIELMDEAEAMGANIVKEVAKRTAQLAGDGTTTAALLAQVIFSEGMKLIGAGTNSVELKKGIDEAVSMIVEGLKQRSTPVDDDFEKIRSVATISSNNDEEIGAMITDAFRQIGTKGELTIEESQTYKSYVEIAKGFKFDRGYISKAFVNKSSDLTCELNNPAILIYQDNITSFNELIPILEMTVAAKVPIPLVVICESLQGEAIMGVVGNVSQRKIPVCFIPCPGFGESKKETLDDIAALTGATVLNEEFGVRLDGVTKSYFGSCDRIKVMRDSTIIFGGSGNEDDIRKRIEEATKQIDLAENIYEEKMHKERLAKLSNSLGVFYVGATSLVEMKEKKDRVEDAILATKSAIEEGVVPGGGSALFNIQQDCYNTAIEIPKLSLFERLFGVTIYDKMDSDFNKGFILVFECLSTPIKQICYNCGVDASPILEEIKTKVSFGYNSKTGKVENLADNGVIDPTKVVRVALENAASVAGTLLTTEVLVVDAPNKNQM